MTASTPEPLTGAEVSALRAVAEGATPGPWEMDDTGWGVLNDEQRICSTGHFRNADHIATFDPPTILRLLALAEDHARLVGVVAAVEAERDKYLAAFSEQFDQREEYATECKRLWKVEAAVEALADRWTRDGLTHGRLLRAALDTTATEEGA